LKTFALTTGIGLDRDAAGESLLGLLHGARRGSN
jgi:hypothetical protein